MLPSTSKIIVAEATRPSDLKRFAILMLNRANTKTRMAKMELYVSFAVTTVSFTPVQPVISINWNEYLSCGF